MAQTVFENRMTRTSLLNLVHPINSIYITTQNIDPASLFGGTWVQITDKFLLGATIDQSATGAYINNTTDGAMTVNYTPSGATAGHVLTENEIPSHVHNLNQHSHSGGYTISTDNGHVHPWRGYFSRYATGDRQATARTRVSGDPQDSGNFLTGGAHTHTVSGVSGAASGNTTATGSGTAHAHGFTGIASTIEIIPPYLAVYIWKRTA